jgi:hypothetical protein
VQCHVVSFRCGDRLQSQWQASQRDFEQNIGKIDDGGCIKTDNGGPKICIGLAAIEAIGARAVTTVIGRLKDPKAN